MCQHVATCKIQCLLLLQVKAEALWNHLKLRLIQQGLLHRLNPGDTIALRSMMVLIDGSLIPMNQAAAGTTASTTTPPMPAATTTPHIAADTSAGTSATAENAATTTPTSDASGGSLFGGVLRMLLPNRPANVDLGAVPDASSSTNTGLQSASHQSNHAPKRIIRPPAVLLWLPAHLPAGGESSAASFSSAQQHDNAVYRAGEYVMTDSIHLCKLP